MRCRLLVSAKFVGIFVGIEGSQKLRYQHAAQRHRCEERQAVRQA